MHADDVADLVADEFADLERRLGDRPDLRARDSTLLPGPQIRIRFGARALASELVPTGLAVPAGPRQYQQAGMRIPILGTGGSSERELVLCIDCPNWDGDPPEIDLRLPDDGKLDEWPKDPQGGGIVEGHPDYDRPFFCRPGTREYHTHPVHADDPWDRHREGMTLAAIIVPVLDDLTKRFVLR